MLECDSNEPIRENSHYITVHHFYYYICVGAIAAAKMNENDTNKKSEKSLLN